MINIFYRYLHLFAVASVIVGLVNLLPLPNLDGGQLLIQSIERARKKPLPRKQKAKIFALAFLCLYLSILFTNLDNMPGYIDSRVKKVHEIIDQNILKKEGEGRNG
ncbi:MAG: site-2 protease family protein [Pseudomonadota bacterium]